MIWTVFVLWLSIGFLLSLWSARGSVIAPRQARVRAVVDHLYNLGILVAWPLAVVWEFLIVPAWERGIKRWRRRHG